MKRFFALLAVIVFLLAFTGCAQQESVQIVATTMPVYDFTVRLCAGTDLQVGQLVTESVSCLHDYSLQVRQMRMLEQAQLVVLSGGGLEDFLDAALLSSHNIVDASAGIDFLCGDHDHESEHDHGHSHASDPHIWLSPVLAQEMAQNICTGLSAAYPEYSEYFLENLQLLLQDLQALQAYGVASLSTLSSRELVTFHDGFAYFAQAFDLQILRAIEEESGREASAAELIDMIHTVEDAQLSAIFTECNGSVSAAEIIAAETGCSIYSLDMAMSGSSYFDAMYRNIETIKEALG